MKAIMRAEREMKDSGIEWIGTIPHDWSVSRVGNYFFFNSGDTLTNESIKDDGVFPVYGANGKRGYYHQSNVDGEHILLGRVGALCGNVHITCKPVWVTEHALISNKKQKAVNKYYGYVFESMNLIQYSKASAQPVISASTLTSLRFTVPSYEEQKHIANYLDDRCSKIDAIIAEAKVSIEEYKELKQAVIYEAVTKGLDKNAPMKDSGIEWIEKIPTHYQFIKLKYLVTRSITDGTHNTPEYDSPLSGSPFLSSKDVTKGYIDWSNIKYITKSLHEKLQKEIAPQKNDILLAKNGTIGIAAVVDTDEKFDIYVTLAVIRPNPKIVISQYLYYVINSWVAKRQFSEHLIGIGVPNLHLNVINNTKVTLPPIDEQKTIIKYLNNECEKLDVLIATKQSLIEDLEAYKKSLIYEVVTGKRKVVE